MSTLTASSFAAGIPQNHAGENANGAVITVAVTATAASKFLLCAVPNGATITGWAFYGDDAAADQVINLGTSASPSALGSFSLSGAQSVGSDLYANLVPCQVSLSDDVSSVMLIATNDVAISASASYRFMVTYHMDMPVGLKIK